MLVKDLPKNAQTEIIGQLEHIAFTDGLTDEEEINNPIEQVYNMRLCDLLEVIDIDEIEQAHKEGEKLE